MSRFTVRLAEIPVEIECLHTAPERLCLDYLTSEDPQFAVKTGAQSIAFERERSGREAALRGEEAGGHSDAYLETLAVYRGIAEKMPFYNTVLFHCSAVAVDGKAYLFTAPSGTGKSTHVRLWRQMFGSRAAVINDDKPLLRILPQETRVYGTPWNGKHRLSTNTSAPVKAVCLLERGERNSIEELSFSAAYPVLLQQTYRPMDPAALGRTLELLDALERSVRFYRLRCNMDPEAAAVAWRGMNETGETI